ncbi:MAG TPA: pyridoxamine 5'-phosphate oxidase family protein [Chitinophagaceae bacterium]
MSKKHPTEKLSPQEEAVAKFKQLVGEVNTCMFTTIDDNLQLFSRPMATVKVDDEGNAWFFTNEFSEKVNAISRDNTVHLIYAHPKQNIYFTVKGSCMVVLDRARMKEMWKPSMKVWMPAGLEDPKLCLLKVITEDAHYWNSTSGKMAIFLNKLKGREKLSGTSEGQLKLQ